MVVLLSNFQQKVNISLILHQAQIGLFNYQSNIFDLYASLLSSQYKVRYAFFFSCQEQTQDAEDHILLIFLNENYCFQAHLVLKFIFKISCCSHGFNLIQIIETLYQRYSNRCQTYFHGLRSHFHNKSIFIQIYLKACLLLQQIMKILIDNDNFVKINPETGGRIIHLVLNGHTIIQAKQPYSDGGSGMFLMFPWISKSPENPYQPELKNHYHGFSINTPREIQIEYLSKFQIVIKLRQVHQHTERNNFEQTYILSKGKLSINFKVIQNQNDKHPYCFGYHPYLEIDGKNLEELEIKTDISTLLEFDEDILPVYPFKRREITVGNKGTYNNLFEGGTYFELISNGVHAKLTSNLPFWQIYSPAERTKIAVQPASFCGNIYSIYKQDPSINLVKEGTITFEVWND